MYFGNSSNVPATVTPTTVPSHNHSASNITSGTLSLSRGGTGATSASSACSNIGALPTSGGTITGALTVNGAVHLNNAAIRLGADSSSSLCKINIGDGDYIHLYEYEDDKLEIKGSTINFVTSNLLHNGNALGGNSVKIVTGQTSTTSHSNYTVNVGFKPMVVVYCVDPHVVGIYVRYDSINSVCHTQASSEGWWGNDMTNNGFIALVSKAPTSSTYKIGYVAIG